MWNGKDDTKEGIHMYIEEREGKALDRYHMIIKGENRGKYREIEGNNRGIEA